MKNRQPTEAELIGRLHRELGATVSLNIRDLPSCQRAARTQRQVNASLIRHWPEADMYEWAKQEPLLTIVWPYIPRASDLVTTRRLLIRDCGIWPERVNHLYCVPEPLVGQPKPDQIAKYLPWLMKALETAETRWVVLMGSRAIWTWRPDLKPSQVYGKVGVWRDTWYVYPMEHPKDVDRRLMPEWAMQWRGLQRHMGEDHLLTSLSDQCVKCGGSLYMYDADGIPWCQEHTQDGLKAQKDGAKKWAALSINAGQIELYPPGK